MCVLAVMWCLATLAFVLAHSAIDGLHFAGPYGGLFGGDQLRYLAWIRDAGLHGLIADPFRAGAPHVYLQPVFLLSGLLWRAGLSIQAAYLVWTPVALISLVWGYANFTGRYLSGRERVAALALALLFLSPLAPLFDYGGVVNANGANYLVIASGHGASYWQAWGYLPTTIALGLMPVVVLGVFDTDGAPRAPTRTALAGLLVAWLHPWGGIELVLMIAARLALRRRAPDRRVVALIGAVIALPLVYYAVLAGVDPAWSLSRLRAGGDPLWPVLFAFGPLVAFALPALGKWPRDRLDQALALWIAAAAVTFIALPGSRYAALEGVGVPLAVLAVQGWRRLHVGRGWAWAAVSVAIVPGAFYSAHTFHDFFDSHDVPFALTNAEQHAVDSLQGDRGRVLATRYLAQALPALAGLLDGQVTAGTNALFDGKAPSAAVAATIAATKASVVVSDCLPRRADLTSLLASLGFTEQRYGCARVYHRGE